MASESSTRLWRVHRDAGRPWPVICPEDDLIDYMVMEAVSIKVRVEDAAAQKAADEAAKRKEFKRNTNNLSQFR